MGKERDNVSQGVQFLSLRLSPLHQEGSQGIVAGVLLPGHELVILEDAFGLLCQPSTSH